MKLKPLALGIALGIIWGGALCITTLVSTYTGYARLFLETIPQSVYPGYTISLFGSVLGLIYGFVDGLVGGALISWIYNRIAK
jgi:hypothetical protein